MNIKITGASGYLGQLIFNKLVKKGHSVSAVSRKLLYSPTEELANFIIGADVVINLAGASIFQLWTKKSKKRIYDSRIITTKNLADAINQLPLEKQPQKFISISAIGIYKSGLSHDENSTVFSSNFDGIVAHDWENASDKLSSHVNRIIFRTGLVLGKKAKTITYSKLPFNLGLGAKLGTGKQPFPFIHETDLANAFSWAVEDTVAKGVYNLVAPQKITNTEFTKTLAKVLNRPAIFRIPAFILKLILGDASSLLTESPEVCAEKLTGSGFKFKYPEIYSALSEILKK